MKPPTYSVLWVLDMEGKPHNFTVHLRQNINAAHQTMNSLNTGYPKAQVIVVEDPRE